MIKPGLGRGLSTLIPTRSTAAPAAPEPPSAAPPAELPIARISPNPFQPRRRFDPDQLNELAQSIRVDGIIQPIVVRAAGDRYQIIAGERRWRAAQMAGLETIPVSVQNLADDRMLEVALVENIQREDLNPIETAIAFQRLCEDLGLSHEEIGRRTGKDRATISNAIRLLQLPEDVQGMVALGDLSPGHARAFLKVGNPDRIRELAQRAVQEHWSVRRAEQESSRGEPVKRDAPVLEGDPNVRAAIAELERVLSTRVKLVEGSSGKGRIEIEYYSPEDLDRIYSLIVRERD